VTKTFDFEQLKLPEIPSKTVLYLQPTSQDVGIRTHNRSEPSLDGGIAIENVAQKWNMTNNICGSDYAAVFNGFRRRAGLVPTVCTVGYKYGVGFADLIGA